MSDQSAEVASYGVRIKRHSDDWLDDAAESLETLGYAIVDSGFNREELSQLATTFASMRSSYLERYGEARLRQIGEHELVRCPLAEDKAFLSLAANPRILALCERLLGPGFILNQQNGVINPAGAKTYSQSRYHRDLPYQHFVSSQPIAINALFCLDAFTLENGATYVLPASHKQEAFPSKAYIDREARQIAAPAGSFLVLDCMAFHKGGENTASADRRAINHVYTIAPMRQQIDFHAYLGDDFVSDPSLRQLLGFNHPSMRSVEDYFASRDKRTR